MSSSGLPRNTKAIATTGDFDVQAAFDLPQVFIELAAQVGQAVIVGGLEDYVPRYLDSVQSTSKINANTRNKKLASSQRRRY